jgi:tetraacyldisaccharide 4'-kinase
LESIRQKVKQLSPSAILAESTHRPQQWRSSDDQTRPLDELRGRRVLAVAAIGHPEPFFASLERLDMQLADKLIWPDHHHFQRDDVQRIAARAQQTDVDAIVCTHKDLVKLAVPRLGGRPVWALQIGLEIYSGREPLCERLTEAVRDAPRDG